MEQEKSKLNERIEEEKISNSRDRENLEEEWKTKLEKEKREHYWELRQLKEEGRSGKWIREIREQQIKIKKKGLEELEEYSKKRDESREEECKRGKEAREELWEKTFELQKHQSRERELQNELRMLSKERERTENETLRNYTVQIEQLEAKARLKNEMEERVV